MRNKRIALIREIRKQMKGMSNSVDENVEELIKLEDEANKALKFAMRYLESGDRRGELAGSSVPKDEWLKWEALVK